MPVYGSDKSEQKANREQAKQEEKRHLTTMEKVLAELKETNRLLRKILN